MIVRVNELAEIDAGIAWDSSWRVARLVDSEYQSICGKGERGAYTIKMSRQKCDWKMKIGDFISYAEAEKKNAILILSEAEWQEVSRHYQGHAYNEPVLRHDEPEILIHSTTHENWEQIRRDGCLKSWNCVKQANQTAEDHPIGHVLGDPEEFRDYIMFGSGVSCEIVVSSKQAGRLVADPNLVYQSGARLYFDARMMAEDGLLVRDGNHLKVKERLPLEPYMIWAATWETLGLSGRKTTPNIFAEEADKAFERIRELGRTGK